MNPMQQLLKRLIENPEPELAQAMESVGQSEDPGQWENLIWQMSQLLGRGVLEKRLETLQEPAGSKCPHCEEDSPPPSRQSDAGLSPP